MGKDRYKELFERSADAILIIRDDKFVDCNQATVNMLRYKSRSALLNTHPSQLSPPLQPDGRPSFEKANEMIETAFKKGSHRFEWMHKKADGTVFPVEVLLTAVAKDAQRTLHVVWRDISERRAKETDLLRLKSIVESTTDLIASAFPDGRVFYANQAATRILGELDEDTHARIPDFHPEWALEIIMDKGIPHAVEHGIWEGETAALTAQGGEIPVSQVIMAHKDASGTLLYLSTIMRDMSDHYRSRSERLELQNRLHQAQKMEAIGTLAGGIAHDFNNILSGIFGYCQLAKNHVGSPEKALADIDEILRGSQKAADLIQQILTFSRKTPHTQKPVSIAGVILDTLKLLRASLPAFVEIKETLQSQARVMADTTKIHQVVMNLCTNAYQAMGESGGTIFVGLSDICIHTHGGTGPPPGDYVRLIIKDTGPGMPGDVKEKIFEPYFTTKPMNQGTGLGLAVVHGIIEEHSGYIRLDNSQGSGATFTIHLPVTQRTGEAPEATPEKTALHPATESIMLVDDEASILNSTKDLLEHYGYSVTPFSNGLDALDAITDTPAKFDIVVSDVTMPGMTGDVLAGKILAQRRDLPVILCSGYSDNVPEEALLDLGVRCFMRKPVQIHDLVSRIQHLLSGPDK